MERIENILNFKKNDEYLSTSGQPTEVEFNLIANEGFDVVINFRPEEEMLGVFDERRLVENLGLKYFQIPMTFDTLNNQILSKFFEVLEYNNGKKIFVHCHRNIRVSVLIILYRLIILGWEREVALKEFSEFIEVTPMWEDYIDEHIRQFSVQ
ncbi:MAG: hypothetical protein KKF21_02650 [Bacteroidetes bacterium]|nr:hypothetical protein [Bacteroidota bacterium]MBU1797265.1 hypothetical protein [Bacteroidota bacterium]